MTHELADRLAGSGPEYATQIDKRLVSAEIRQGFHVLARIGQKHLDPLQPLVVYAVQYRLPLMLSEKPRCKPPRAPHFLRDVVKANPFAGMAANELYRLPHAPVAAHAR